MDKRAAVVGETHQQLIVKSCQLTPAARNRYYIVNHRTQSGRTHMSVLFNLFRPDNNKFVSACGNFSIGLLQLKWIPTNHAWSCQKIKKSVGRNQ